MTGVLDCARAAAAVSARLGDWKVRGQLALDVGRTYWEHHGPKDWRAVTVRVRYATGVLPVPHPALAEVRTGSAAPRNVLVERADGTMDVRPVRLLRTRCPSRPVP